MTPTETSGEAEPRPLVSVLVPSYNGAKWLREALDSILAQTYAPIEVILLDDHSDDETPEIAAEYGDRITYVRQPRNMGIYDNVNVGIEMAAGELIATYHADDIYLPTIVEKQVAYLQEHPEVGAVFCADIFVDAEGREYYRLPLPEAVAGDRPIDYPTVLSTLMRHKNSFLVCPSAMVRKAVHDTIGPYRQDVYRNTSDLEMWLRISKSYPIAVLEEHLMKYRHFHGNSSSRYHHLRTDVENYFWIMDEYLDDGGLALVDDEARVNFEAHRSEDRIKAAISHYIKGESKEGRAELRKVRLGVIARARHVQRWRLIALTLGLWVFLRLPRVPWLADRMFDRWHVKRPPKIAS